MAKDAASHARAAGAERRGADGSSLAVQWATVAYEVLDAQR